jgi:hypothetical protein
LVARLIATTRTTLPATAPTLLLGARPDDLADDHVLGRARLFPEGSRGEFAAACPGGPAVAQMEDMRRVGVADYLVIPKAAFPWVTERVELDFYLRGHYGVAAEDDSCRIYDLREPHAGAFLDAVLPPAEPVIALLGAHSQLLLASRRLYRATTLEAIEQHRSEGVRFLVVPDARPWMTEDREILAAVERRFERLATRPGVCAIFDVRGNG